MGEESIPAGRGIVPGQVAEIIVALDGGPGRRGSGYRVGPGAVLTAAHVIDGAASMRVRFDADLPGEWTAEVLSCWSDVGVGRHVGGRSVGRVPEPSRDGPNTIVPTAWGRLTATRLDVARGLDLSVGSSAPQ